MKTYAADAYDEIRARIGQIREAAKEMCPMASVRTLHDCLRGASPCSPSCPNAGDWIGPEKTA